MSLRCLHPQYIHKRRDETTETAPLLGRALRSITPAPACHFPLSTTGGGDCQKQREFCCTACSGWCILSQGRKGGSELGRAGSKGVDRTAAGAAVPPAHGQRSNRCSSTAPALLPREGGERLRLLSEKYRRWEPGEEPWCVYAHVPAHTHTAAGTEATTVNTRGPVETHKLLLLMERKPRSRKRNSDASLVHFCSAYAVHGSLRTIPMRTIPIG